jgi:hypothetical protein
MSVSQKKAADLMFLTKQIYPVANHISLVAPQIIDLSKQSVWVKHNLIKREKNLKLFQTLNEFLIISYKRM